MSERFYATGAFAARAAISERTLRYYDHLGLLSPSYRTEAGYRRYTDNDLETLQQILALKALGFSLAEIQALSAYRPQAFRDALEQQLSIMQEKARRLDGAIRAISRTLKRLDAGTSTPDDVADILKVIAMEQDNNWKKNYLTAEQLKAVEDLSAEAYSPAAKAKMAHWPEWTAEDQKEIDAAYQALAQTLKSLVQAGADPGSPQAQEAAKTQVELAARFTQGDPEISRGLQNFWQAFDNLPEAQKPPLLPWGKEEGEFLSRALAIFHGANS